MTLSALLVGGLLLWVFWMIAATASREAARSKLSFVGRTEVPASDLRHCIENPRISGLGIRNKGGTWKTWADSPAVSRAENNARHIQVHVVEAGTERILRFYTRDGRPMRDAERALIGACLAGKRHG